MTLREMIWMLIWKTDEIENTGEDDDDDDDDNDDDNNDDDDNTSEAEEKCENI